MRDELVVPFLITSDSTKPEQPPILNIVPEEFNPNIGKLIVRWAILEQEMHALTGAVMRVNGTSVAGQVDRSFKRRWQLLQDEWAIFIGDNKELQEDMMQTNREVDKGKFLRDCIAHKRMTCGLDAKGGFARFENNSKTHPLTKRYYIPDFEKAWMALTMAAGRLYRLLNLDYAEFFQPQTLSLLRQLPDMGYLRFPKIPKQ